MGVEIERKFLVDSDLWHRVRPAEGSQMVQGYIYKSPDRTVRVRLKENAGFLTIKGKTTGATRAEFEYEIPGAEAREMLDTFCDQLIDKVRYEIVVGGKIWEIDEFAAPQKGLLLAEIELNNENEPFTRPDWVTEEVTGQSQYYNANMI
ncbi:MAG: CYTH domain-containing protein [Bacteroidota bacterium]